MTILPLVTTPNPVLRQEAKAIDKIDKKIKKLISDMADTLNGQTDPQGVGLAACQVGVPLRIFLMKPTSKSPITVFINPEIIPNPNQSSDRPPSAVHRPKTKLLEGCLSVPNYYSDIKRADTVTVQYTTLDIKTTQVKSHIQTFTGLPAQIVQHEIDHLKGKLFVDLVLSQKQKLLKLNGDTWEEVKLGPI